MITLYVIRHGQTDWNIEGRMQGHTNIPLNKNGHNQAEIVANELKDVNFDIIISSPLDRALDTAKHVNTFKNAPIIINNKLIERSFGDLEGKTSADLSNIDFSIIDLLDYTKNYDKYNIETIQDLFIRMEEFVENIKKDYKDENKTILISTHNGIAQVLDVILKKLPKTTNLLDVSFKNCEYRRYLIND